MRLPIGQLCAIVRVDNPHLQHCLGHFCVVVSYWPYSTSEYGVTIKAFGDTVFGAKRHHLLPINPDAVPTAPTAPAVHEDEEVTA